MTRRLGPSDFRSGFILRALGDLPDRAADIDKVSQSCGSADFLRSLSVIEEQSLMGRRPYPGDRLSGIYETGSLDCCEMINRHIAHALLYIRV
jgi:hypothetical protein